MNTKFNKVVSAALTATTAVWASGVMLVVPVASAQTTADLQAQIAALLAQITQLQAQLNTGSSVSLACSFARDLTVGSTGADVKCLQQFLNGHGALVSGSGAGSPGNETSYFGTLTKAALAQWQGTKGIVPAVGYFGPITRAAYATSFAGAPAPTPTPTPTPGTPAPAPTPVAPSSGLNVAVSSQNPASGALISSAATAAARVPVLAVDFTAGVSGGITLNGVKFTKTGVISDSSIAGAYLVYNGQIIAQYNSISAGVVDFSGMSFSIPAGQTRTLWFAIDPSTGLTAGNTTAFALSSAMNVVAVDANNVAVTASGTFPMNGNIFTVTSVTNPSIASLTVASSAIATTVTAGTTNNIVGAWTFTAANSKVWLKGINFKMIGSANKSDLKNLKIFVNSTQVGTTLAQVASDGNAYFDLSAAPGTLNTGSNNIQLYGDVMGSPSYNFQFEILNSYDIYAVDSQYNVPVSAASNNGTQVTISQGSITVSQASDTPTGNLAVGQSGVTVAKFIIYAAGEAVRLKFVDFQLAFASSSNTDAGLAVQIGNVALTDDAGGQIGSTITTPPTTNVCPAGGTAAANTHEAALVYTDCFGTAASPVNYVVPANTTRVLSLKMDVKSNASFGTVTGRLVATANNLQGVTSSQTASSGAVSGASLTLSTTQLTVAQNTALGTQNISANSTNVRIGSYAFTASSADGVTISSVNIVASSTDFQNMKVMVNGTQFGVTQGTVTAGGGGYSFSGSPFTVAKGTTLYVDVYADVLSAAVSTTPATQLSGLTGSGLTSFNAVSLTGGTVTGQSITIAGQPTLTIAIDSATPAAANLVMGSTGNSLASWRFTETSNVENVKITDLNVFDYVHATSLKAGFGNLTLYQGTTLVGTAGSAVTLASTSNPGPGFLYAFHFATPVVVPQANSITLTLKGDVSSYSSSGATDNSTHAFKIGTSTEATNDTRQETVVALGNSSNATSAITITVNATGTAGNEMRLLRSKLTVTGAGAGTASGRSKTAVDDLATLTFAADAAGAVTISTVTITFSGSAPSSTATQNFWATGGVTAPQNTCVISENCYTQLYDPASALSYFATGNVTGTSMSFGLNGYTISAGTSKSFTIRTNSTAATKVGVSGVAQTLSMTINAVGDIRWVDALDAAASTNLSLPATAVPVTIQSVSYAAGT